jgi:hypothetical protein
MQRDKTLKKTIASVRPGEEEFFAIHNKRSYLPFCSIVGQRGTVNLSLDFEKGIKTLLKSGEAK